MYAPREPGSEAVIGYRFDLVRPAWPVRVFWWLALTLNEIPQWMYEDKTKRRIKRFRAVRELPACLRVPPLPPWPARPDVIAHPADKPNLKVPEKWPSAGDKVYR